MNPKPDRKALTHERIVETASRAVRRSGYDGVRVAEVMQAAGLTHGGFYAHFPSREAMIVEALERAGQDSARRLGRRIENAPRHGISPLRALVESYLSDAHLAAPENGCPVAALGSEMPRQGPEVLEASRRRVRSLAERVRGALPAGTAPAEAELIASTLVGALQMARALGANAEGKAWLASVRAALLARHDGPRATD